MLSPADAARIRLFPLFAALSAEAWSEVLRAGTSREFARGQLLWTSGTRARGLFVIVNGAVRITRAPAGRQQVVHHEGAGGTIGEVPLFTGGVYPATATATSDTRCIVLDRHAVARVIACDAEFAFRLLRRLAVRVEGLVQRLDERDSSTVEGRLCRLLLLRHSASGGKPFTLGRTQAEAAEEIGTVREVLVRALRGLGEQGIVTGTSRAHYRVADLKALRRLANRHRGATARV